MVSEETVCAPADCYFKTLDVIFYVAVSHVVLVPLGFVPCRPCTLLCV